MYETLLETAKGVLENNWNGTFTARPQPVPPSVELGRRLHRHRQRPLQYG